MAIELWFLLAASTLVLWGVTTFLPKLAVRTLPPLHLTLYSVLFSTIATIGMMAFYGFQLDFDLRGVLLAVVIGILGRLGSLMFLFAIQKENMTYATVVGSLYPVIAAGLSFIILNEHLTSRQIYGMALGVCALILMVVSSDRKIKE